MAFEELARVSAALGRDPLQVQAAGGNTSLKADGLLWVKASGTWLADAQDEPIFVPVDRDAVVARIESGAVDPVAGTLRADRNPRGLKPSIETTLHALLPQAVVLHTHCVRTIALAARRDAEAALAARLAGLAWRFVPYCRPGLPLTQAVAAACAEGPPAEVIVLGNHGLVVGGESVAAARALLDEVSRRLDAPARAAPEPDPDLLRRQAAAHGLRPVRHERVHGLAHHALSIARARAGSLYPDHVIFLGPGARLAADSGPDDARKLAIVPEIGVFLPVEAGASADALALCLADVLARVPDDAPLCYLEPAEEAALAGWDAEKHRQTLARARERRA